MLVFETGILEFEFDRHLKHMVSYHGVQSGLLVFLVGEFGVFEIFMQKPDFYISPTGNVENRSCLDRI